MGACTYCGEPAGLLRSECKNCIEKRRIATLKIPEFILRSAETPVPPERFQHLLAEVAHTHHIKDEEFRRLSVAGLSSLAAHLLADHLLTAEEETHICGLRDALGVTAEEMQTGGVHDRLVKAGVLRDLNEGKIPQRIQVAGHLPNLQRGETIIWAFFGATYLTPKSRTHYVGGSHGVSIRIMSGVYYRVGASKGERVQTTYLSNEGNGTLFITNRAVYFLGQGKAVKAPTSKIMSIKPYNDGIEIIRDAASAKPQIFLIDDPWFAVNVIMSLSRIDA